MPLVLPQAIRRKYGSPSWRRCSTPAVARIDKAVLAELLSIPAGEYYQPLVLGAEDKKERTLAALIGQFEAIAAANRVLMVFEDIHWIDPTSRALLERIVGLVERLPVLLVLTFRPEFRPPWLGAIRTFRCTCCESLTAAKALRWSIT